MSENLKYDDGKLLMSLVDQKFIDGVAEILTFGAKKYKPSSWQFISDAPRRYEDALLRHISAWRRGELIDEESGFSHLKHIACNVMFLMHFEKEKK